MEIGVFGTLTELRGVTDPRLQEAARASHETVDGILRRYKGEAAAIEASAELTAFGRRQRIAALKRAAASELDEARRQAFGVYSLAQLAEERQRVQGALEKRLFAQPTGDGLTMVLRGTREEREAEHHRAREIRDRLLALPEVKRLAALQTAAAENDLELLRAVASAPRAFPIVPAAQWEAVDHRHRELHHRAETERLAALDALEQTIQFNLNAGRTALGVAPADPSEGDPASA